MHSLYLYYVPLNRKNSMYKPKNILIKEYGNLHKFILREKRKKRERIIYSILCYELKKKKHKQKIIESSFF